MGWWKKKERTRGNKSQATGVVVGLFRPVKLGRETSPAHVTPLHLDAPRTWTDPARAPGCHGAVCFLGKEGYSVRISSISRQASIPSGRAGIRYSPTVHYCRRCHSYPKTGVRSRESGIPQRSGEHSGGLPEIETGDGWGKKYETRHRMEIVLPDPCGCGRK